MSDSQIDLVKYGQLWEKVDQLTTKVDKIEENMEELLELAHKGLLGGYGCSEWTIHYVRLFFTEFLS